MDAGCHSRRCGRSLGSAVGSRPRPGAAGAAAGSRSHPGADSCARLTFACRRARSPHTAATLLLERGVDANTSLRDARPVVGRLHLGRVRPRHRPNEQAGRQLNGRPVRDGVTSGLGLGRTQRLALTPEEVDQLLPLVNEAAPYLERMSQTHNADDRMPAELAGAISSHGAGIRSGARSYCWPRQLVN